MSGSLGFPLQLTDPGNYWDLRIVDDDIALDVHGTVAEVLADDLGGATPADAPAEDDEDDSAAAGPLTIAVDVNETEAGSADNPAP